MVLFCGQEKQFVGHVFALIFVHCPFTGRVFEGQDVQKLNEEHERHVELQSKHLFEGA